MAPLALFVSFYLATLFAGAWSGFIWVQWTALVAVSCASAATIALWHHRKWDLGLAGPPTVAIREAVFGLIASGVLIGSADVLILLFTTTWHSAGSGFPFRETLAVFLPAALHEELLFRGYPYQLIRQRNRGVAIAISSVVFAALHAGNNAVTALALINVGLGGVFLAVAYERYRRLWLPMGLHLGWNLMSGPILGYGVSGYTAGQSMLVTAPEGPRFLSGGAFGIEGSVCMTVVELAAIALMARGQRFRLKNPD